MDIGIVRIPVIGPPGKNAYELAVQNGYMGTLNEWLDSLKGEIGPQGFKGDIGPQGLQGDPGETSYGIAVTNGYVGS